MNNLPTGRNDPCPCGSGKKFKKCCLRRQPDPKPGRSAKREYDAILPKIRDTLADCIISHDYVNCLDWLFGISSIMSEDSKNTHARIGESLHAWSQELDVTEKAKGVAVIKDPDLWLKNLKGIREDLEEANQNWKSNGALRILCSDIELRRIAYKVKEEGIVVFSKAEFDQRFDISAYDPFWCNLPDYVEVSIGSGLFVSSPDQDMFRAMCRSYDEAVLSDRARDKARQNITNWNATAGNEFLELNDMYFQNTRQVVINACLFVEAFVNSVAHAYRCKPGTTLTQGEDLRLRERAIDKNTGAERERFVKLLDKLHDWIKLVSPRDETFDKGANPYRAFCKIQEYRDSIVHLSASKIEKYRRIDLPLASQAVDVALDIVKAICRYIALSPGNVAYPKWLAERNSDGLFNISGQMALSPNRK